MIESNSLPVEEPLSGASYSAVEYDQKRHVVWLLDQRQIPERELYVGMGGVEQVAEGIRAMVVRGAPAIGITAAYGMILAAREGGRHGDAVANVREAAERLRKTRPTAVNLAWAIDRMLGIVERWQKQGNRTPLWEELLTEARGIHTEDVEACRRMGQLGAELIPDGATILTHCNAGALATGGYGTALGVVRAAHERGKDIKVLADETRPYWQGARLTSWELHRDGIAVEVITDNMAAHFFGTGEVDVVVTGADRVARNGDVANKIGTYGLACLAQLHDKPMLVAAPWSTVDMACPAGERIPIEERDGEELRKVGDMTIVPDGVSVRYPAFDVTPASMVTALITERGVVQGEYQYGLERLQAAHSQRS